MPFPGDISVPMVLDVPYYDDNSVLQYAETLHNAGFDFQSSGGLTGTQNNNYWRAYLLTYVINLWSYYAMPQAFAKGVGQSFVNGAGAIFFGGA